MQTSAYRAIRLGSALAISVVLSLTKKEVAASDAVTRPIYLGRGSVSVRVQPRAQVELEPGFEIAWYRIVQPDRTRFRRMLVAVTGSDVVIESPGVANAVCINGLRGWTTVTGGERNVVLKLPETTGMFKILFGFQNDDSAAWDIVRSVAVQGHRGHC